MFLERKDGSLEWFCGHKAVTLNPSTVESDYTLPNGNVIRMICSYGEKVLVRDDDAIRRAFESSPGSRLVPTIGPEQA